MVNDLHFSKSQMSPTQIMTGNFFLSFMENFHFNSVNADSTKCHGCACSFLFVVFGYQASFVFVCAVNVLLCFLFYLVTLVLCLVYLCPVNFPYFCNYLSCPDVFHPTCVSLLLVCLWSLCLLFSFVRLSVVHPCSCCCPPALLSPGSVLLPSFAS